MLAGLCGDCWPGAHPGPSNQRGTPQWLCPHTLGPRSAWGRALWSQGPTQSLVCTVHVIIVIRQLCKVLTLIHLVPGGV